MSEYRVSYRIKRRKVVNETGTMNHGAALAFIESIRKQSKTVVLLKKHSNGVFFLDTIVK